MIKKILTLSFISLVILVLADDTNGHQCEASNYDCRCYRLMKPMKANEEPKTNKKVIMERCAAQLNVTLPPKEEGENKRKMWETLPDSVKNCIATSILTKNGQMDAQGKIVVSNATAIVTEAVNANKGPDVADAQVASIIAAVPGCAAHAATQQLTGHAYFVCMKGNCTLALQKGA